MYDVLLGIGLDDEKRAVAQAEVVADLPDAPNEVTAHLCHVFQDNPEGASVHQLGTVRRAREILEEAGVNCVHYEASGDPGEELIAAADEVDADLICVSGRKRSPAGKAVFGSTTQTVVLNADRPVLAVPGPDGE
ncbi:MULTISPECIES: universal stress protein [Halorubrum]|uniref:Universal stress protein family protein n=2 Tax=Halorubrum TaxID=56688 RepID=A0A1I6HWV7_HALSD|nr:MULTISPECIES: universal stress protein [Halorubrum]TKX54440.1 universal stress protein [Halorubrum sp. SP3]TKX70853.1 universal stress protein [Halorubrum sp. SP9]SFR58952.1 Universal stress protein family protein [Halorubrum sodomense]